MELGYKLITIKIDTLRKPFLLNEEQMAEAKSVEGYADCPLFTKNTWKRQTFKKK